MKTIIIAISFLFLHWNSSAQGNQSALKLQAAIEIALTNDIPVKEKELDVEAAKANYKQAQYNRLPQLTADINYGVNNGRSIDPFTNTYNNQQLSSSNGNLTAAVPVFQGFQTKQSIKQNRLTFEAVKAETQQEKDNLVLNVILAFLQALKDEDVLSLDKQLADVTLKQVQRLQALDREGAIAPSQLSDLQGQYATDQLSIVNAANALETSKLKLAQLMNIPYNKDIMLSREGMDISMDAYTNNPEQLYDSALQKLSLVKGADLRYKAAAKGIKIAAAAYYPSVSLFGQVNSNYSSAARIYNPTTINDVETGDYVVVAGTNIPVITKQTTFNDQKINYFNQFEKNLNTYYGVSLQIPLFTAFKTRTNVSLARIDARRAALVKDNTRIQLKQAIEQAYLDMKSADDRYQLLQEQVKAFTESFRAAEIKFEAGVFNQIIPNGQE